MWPILINLRGSEAYCNAMKHSVDGMTRTLGCPSYFVTLGPCDREWRDLLYYLYIADERNAHPSIDDETLWKNIRARMAAVDAEMDIDIKPVARIFHKEKKRPRGKSAP